MGLFENSLLLWSRPRGGSRKQLDAQRSVSTATRTSSGGPLTRPSLAGCSSQRDSAVGASSLFFHLSGWSLILLSTVLPFAMLLTLLVRTCFQRHQMTYSGPPGTSPSAPVDELNLVEFFVRFQSVHTVSGLRKTTAEFASESEVGIGVAGSSAFRVRP